MRVVWLVFVKLLLVLVILSSTVLAQQKDIPLDTLRAKLNYYSSRQPGSVLFAHFDKTIYNPTETAWFTAYLLNNKKTNNPSVLSAILVSEAGKSVVLSLKFAMKNGVTYGNVDIPDSLKAGNYSFILYTNVLANKQPHDTYTQHISIKELVKAGTETILLKPIINSVVNLTAGKPSLRFYPEGGNLVNAMPGIIGIEARDANGKPLKLKAILYQDKRVADTIFTDNFGMGRFKLNPHLKSTYVVKIIGDNTPYWLPKIFPYGPALHIINGVVNDSLQLSLWDTHSSRYHIIVHNYQNVFYSWHAKLSAALKTITLSMKNVPKGISVITMLDSFNRPVAERLFFAHYNREANIDINTDKEVYRPREQVTMKLKLNNYALDTLSGTVSVSVVQAGRLQPDHERDITSYFYLRHNLANLPSKPFFLSRTKADKSLLENVLLIQGWRRYTWPEMISSTAGDIIEPIVMGVEGFADKTYLDPFSALVDVIGKIDIAHYFSNQDKRVVNLLNQIVFIADNQEKEINMLLAKKLMVKKPDVSVYNNIAAEAQPVTLIKNNMLNTVNVHSTKLYNYIANKCGDYVCRFNVLNCVTHKFEKDNTTPRLKMRYTVDDSTLLAGNQRVTIEQTFRDDKGKRIFIVSYNGCSNLKADIELVNNEGLTDYREFYSSDYKQITNDQPDYLSTIYWKHAVKVNSNKEAELTFFTSDALGPFKITVQGLTGKDVVNSEKLIVVKDP